MSKEFEVTYKGKWVSTNDLRNNNWRKNQSLKKKYREVYAVLMLEKKPPKMDKVKISIRYNSRTDIDNVSMKYFIDAMKDIDVIPEDNKNHVKELSFKVDETLPNLTYVVKVQEWQE